MKKTILALLFLIMSFPLFGETYYQNNNKYSVDVQTASGGLVSIPPGKFVGGTFYADLATLGVLTLHVGADPAEADIVYTYVALSPADAILPDQADADGKFLKSVSGEATWDTVTSGITNGAALNVIPKSDGTNLVASSIQDTGYRVDITAASGYEALRLNATGGNSKIFEVRNPSGSPTIQFGYDGKLWFSSADIVGGLNEASFATSKWRIYKNGSSNGVLELRSGANVAEVTFATGGSSGWAYINLPTEIYSNTTGQVPLTVGGRPGQTADLQRWESEYGTPVGRVTAAGGAEFTTAKLSALPVHADNAAATSGGLSAGQLYRTSTGVLMVTY